MSTATKLIWITPTASQHIAYCARVSNPKNQQNLDTAGKLLTYLIKHKHWSPFEMASMCIEINTTRDISAQILRHRSFSFQEFSQRYADVAEIGNPVVPHLRRQDLTNRQNSIDDLPTTDLAKYYRRIGQLFADAENLYQEMVSSGVAKECARKILPINTPTKLYMSGTIRSWIHYVDVRCDVSTQLEHRQIAQQVKEILVQQMPELMELVGG